MLPKIEALIARAVHPDTPVEEARTSAVIALKLIREHEVRLVEKDSPPIFGPRQRSPYGPFGPGLDEIMDMIFRHDRGPSRPWAAEKQAKKRGPRGRRRKCPHGNFEGHCFSCDLEQSRRERQEPLHRRIWTATLPAFTLPQVIKCACCGLRIHPGEKMCWAGDEMLSLTSPMTHERCVTHWNWDQCRVCGRITT